MSQYAPKVLKYELLGNADATINQLGPLEICRNYSWSISWVLNGSVPGDKFEVSVEYSNDGIEWDLFTASTTIDNKTKGAFFHNVWPFLFIRINYRVVKMEPGATISANLILKITT